MRQLLALLLLGVLVTGCGTNDTKGLNESDGPGEGVLTATEFGQLRQEMLDVLASFAVEVMPDTDSVREDLGPCSDEQPDMVSSSMDFVYAYTNQAEIDQLRSKIETWGRELEAQGWVNDDGFDPGTYYRRWYKDDVTLVAELDEREPEPNGIKATLVLAAVLPCADDPALLDLGTPRPGKAHYLTPSIGGFKPNT